MTERVQKLKKDLLGVRPAVSAERIMLATEAAKKYAGEPIYLYRARILEHVLDNKAVIIRDGELIVGTLTEKIRAAAVFPEYNSGKMWLKAALPVMHERKIDPMDVAPDDMKNILECLDWWDGKALEDIMDEYMPREYIEYEDIGIYKSSGRGHCSSWITANFERMFKFGFRGHVDMCKKKISEAFAAGMTLERQRKVEYWQATIIVLEAVIRYANRYAALAEEMAATEKDELRKGELTEIAGICRKVPEHSPETFHEAIQFQWFQHLIIHIEANSAATSLGRFDQHMLPYYKGDIEAGRLTRDKAIELIELLFLKTSTLLYLSNNYYSQANAGFPMWQILSIAGYTEDGKDASNELTSIVLDATDDLRVNHPAIAFRTNEYTPDHLWRKASEMIQAGVSQPAFFADDVAVKAVIDKGGTLEQARNWAIIGCVEPHPGGGICDGSPLAGYFNAVKCLELVLHNGVDPVTGKQAGPKFGDPKNFTCRQDIIDAVQKTVDHFWELDILTYNYTQSVAGTRLPCPYMSVLLDGSIETGLSIQEGGTNMIYSNTWIAGAATVGDSIVAIDHAVFKDKVMTMEELIKFCDNNFEGNERMRQYLINTPPKFGNDIDEVDQIVVDLIDKSCLNVQKFTDSRGGKIAAGGMSQTHCVTFGKFCGATPDGRKAFEPISDNASPFLGRDTSGPTASCNSVAKLKGEHCHGGLLYNIRFEPSGVKGEKGVSTLEGIFREYCKNGGFHIQANVVDNETLRKAQKNPENYRDLAVRVAGYLAYFTELDPQVQESIILRTTHLNA